MVTKTTQVKNGSIILPRELRRTWRNADVYLSGEKDTILIKRLSKPRLSFREMLNEFNKVGKNISQKDVKEALEAVRGRKRNGEQ